MTVCIEFNGKKYPVSWEIDTVRNVSPMELRKFGVWDSEDEKIHVSNETGIDYQRYAALYLQLVNDESLGLTPVELELEIIKIVPEKKREHYVRQRRLMYKGTITHGGPVHFLDVCQSVLTEIEKLIAEYESQRQKRGMPYCGHADR